MSGEEKSKGKSRPNIERATQQITFRHELAERRRYLSLSKFRTLKYNIIKEIKKWKRWFRLSKKEGGFLFGKGDKK